MDDLVGNGDLSRLSLDRTSASRCPHSCGRRGHLRRLQHAGIHRQERGSLHASVPLRRRWKPRSSPCAHWRARYRFDRQHDRVLKLVGGKHHKSDARRAWSGHALRGDGTTCHPARVRSNGEPNHRDPAVACDRSSAGHLQGVCDQQRRCAFHRKLHPHSTGRNDPDDHYYFVFHLHHHIDQLDHYHHGTDDNDDGGNGPARRISFHRRLRCRLVGCELVLSHQSRFDKPGLCRNESNRGDTGIGLGLPIDLALDPTNCQRWRYPAADPTDRQSKAAVRRLRNAELFGGRIPKPVAHARCVEHRHRQLERRRPDESSTVSSAKRRDRICSWVLGR